MGLLGDMGGMNNWGVLRYLLTGDTSAFGDNVQMRDDPNAPFGMFGKMPVINGDQKMEQKIRQMQAERAFGRERAMVKPKDAPIDAITPDMEQAQLAALLTKLNTISHKPNEFVGPQEAAGLEQQRGAEFAEKQQQQADARYADFVGTPFQNASQTTPAELNKLTAPNAVAGGPGTSGRQPSADELRGMQRFGSGYADRVSNAKGEQMGRRMRLANKQNRRSGMGSGDSLRQTLLQFAPQFRANQDDFAMRQAWMSDPAIQALLVPPDPRQRMADDILNMALNRAGSFVG